MLEKLRKVLLTSVAFAMIGIASGHLLSYRNSVDPSLIILPRGLAITLANQDYTVYLQPILRLQQATPPILTEVPPPGDTPQPTPVVTNTPATTREATSTLSPPPIEVPPPGDSLQPTSAATKTPEPPDPDHTPAPTAAVSSTPYPTSAATYTPEPPDPDYTPAPTSAVSSTPYPTLSATFTPEPP